MIKVSRVLGEKAKVGMDNAVCKAPLGLALSQALLCSIKMGIKMRTFISDSVRSFFG